MSCPQPPPELAASRADLAVGGSISVSSTRDIEIITFQILSYEMCITVKQYFVTKR